MGTQRTPHQPQAGNTQTVVFEVSDFGAGSTPSAHSLLHVLRGVREGALCSLGHPRNEGAPQSSPSPARHCPLSPAPSLAPLRTMYGATSRPAGRALGTDPPVPSGKFQKTPEMLALSLPSLGFLLLLRIVKMLWWAHSPSKELGSLSRLSSALIRPC